MPEKMDDGGEKERFFIFLLNDYFSIFNDGSLLIMCHSLIRCL